MRVAALARIARRAFPDTRRWAEAPVKIARMTLTIKLDRNWNSFQLANSAPPLSVTDSAIAPSARMLWLVFVFFACLGSAAAACFVACVGSAVLCVVFAGPAVFCMCVVLLVWLFLLLGPEGPAKIQEVTLMRPIHGNL